MDSTGACFIHHVHRAEAQRLVKDKLATRHDSKTLLLTCDVRWASGQSFPQYKDGRTTMLAYPIHTRKGEWTGAFRRWAR